MLRLLQGDVGSGKSALAKTLVWRGLGWHTLVYEGMPGILAGLVAYWALCRLPAERLLAVPVQERSVEN